MTSPGRTDAAGTGDLSGPGRGRSDEVEPKPWYRRRGVIVTAVVLAVLAVTVITDLPVHSSRAQDISDERSVIGQVNSDVAGCVLAVREAMGLYQQVVAGTLPATDKATSESFLRDDQAACSFTNQSIYDLSTIEVPGSAAGRKIGGVVSSTTLWATSDALGAIEDVQSLTTNPSDGTARTDLPHRLRALAADRVAADNDVRAADRELRARLPMPNLPALTQALAAPAA